VYGAGCTVYDRNGKRSAFLCTPLGVASTLRRAKSKAPALHCRAESPVIISTWQRLVGTSVYQQTALKGRNPAIDSMSPFQGYGDRLPLFTGRCPVLLMTGPSALLPPDVEAVSKALFRHCELRGMKQEAIHVSTKNRKFL
jgi:hypothetical protein